MNDLSILLGELLKQRPLISLRDLAGLRPEMLPHKESQLYALLLTGQRDIVELAKLTQYTRSELIDLRSIDLIPNRPLVASLITNYYNGRIRKLAQDGEVEQLKILIDQMNADLSGFDMSGDVIREYEDYQKTKREAMKSGLLGVSTGIKAVDDLTYGFMGTHVWVVGGWRGSAKSYTGLNFINSVVSQGKRAVLFAMEMSNNENIDRLIGMKGKLSPIQLVGDYHDQELVQKSKESILMSIDAGLLNLFDNVFTVDEMDWRLNQVTQQHGHVDVVVVDFIQLLHGSGSYYEVIRDGALALQRIAKKYNTTVVIISQISNEAQKAGSTQDIDGFKGSGEIGQIANVAMRIYRKRGEDGDYTKHMALHLTKVRHNAGGVVHCAIDFPGGVIRSATVGEVNEYKSDYFSNIKI